MNDQALKNALLPFEEPLNRAGVNEISMNRPHQIIIDSRDGKEIIEAGPSLDQLQALAILIATNTNQKIDAKTPLLSASLPGGERIQIVCPPAVKTGQFALSIRKPTLQQFTLDDYQKQGLLQGTPATDKNNDALLALREQGNIAELLKQAVITHKNILISGGTSSGKTTFANTLIQSIDHDDRIITIEDVSEIVISQPDHLSLIFSKGGQGLSQVTPKALLEACLRLNPDRIFLSELRGEEAFYFLRAANSGHPGIISTLHASSAEGAIDQLVLMIQQGTSNLTEDNIRGFIHKTVDLIVQFNYNRITGRRELTELYIQSDIHNA